MITEDYVSFETAKLLKEKGFDADIDLWYDKDGNIFDCYKYEISRNWRVKAQQEVYFCPTLQMAMKWLREVHNIDIIPFHEKLPNDCYWCRIEKYPYTEYNQEPIYKKYEESLNAAIKYCLENLI